MEEFLAIYWPWVTSIAVLALDVCASMHVILQKRDCRAALGWVGLIWFFPLFGSVLYFVLGINRIHRRAKRLKSRIKRTKPERPSEDESARTGRLKELSTMVGHVTHRPVSVGNRVQILNDGEAAYHAMLEAIAGAQRTVSLASYIFDNDRTGRFFVDALSAAVRRGVAVRVLIDAIGSRYSFPSIISRLRQAGVPTALFMPSMLPWHFTYAQLRNHRKLLVADGRIGFTGGMNIRDGHDLSTHPRHPIVDMQARFEGPVVADMQAVFIDDWLFTSGEKLAGDDWLPEMEEVGGIVARGIASGPDDEKSPLQLTYLGALAAAEKHVIIASPYFLPDPELISALGLTALRGVEVDILVPNESNLRMVQWAMMGQFGQVIEPGCKIWMTPPPFDHTKLMVVDGRWCLIGSSNWDSRSTRLNFEFNVECYDEPLAEELAARLRHKMKAGHRLTQAQLKKRNLLVKLRDGTFRLASPYL